MKKEPCTLLPAMFRRQETRTIEKNKGVTSVVRMQFDMLFRGIVTDITLAGDRPVAPAAPTPHTARDLALQDGTTGQLIFPVVNTGTDADHLDTLALHHTTDALDLVSGVARAEGG